MPRGVFFPPPRRAAAAPERFAIYGGMKTLDSTYSATYIRHSPRKRIQIVFTVSRAEQNSTAAPGVETPNLTPVASSISPNDNEDEK